MNNNKNVSVFGDSISKGVVFDTATKKYKVIKDNSAVVFSKLSGAIVENYSRFGYTSSKSLSSLKSFIKKGKKSDYALIELGGNDCDYKWVEVSSDPFAFHKAKTPLNEFKENILSMIKTLNSKGIKPILMNLPPIDSELYFNWISTLDGVDKDRVLIWLKEKNMLYRHQELYSLNLERIAISNNVPLINVRDSFLSIKNLRDYLCIDGIHLNEKGHKLLGNLYYDFAQAKGF